MFVSIGSVVALAAAALAQDRTTFEGRPALRIANDRLELTLLLRGGAFVSLTSRDDPARVNPMWDPVRMAREAGQQPWSSDSMGHFVCVDGFGPVSEQERAAGLPGHGEAHRQPWSIVAQGRKGKTVTVTLRAQLPLVQEVFTRTIRLTDGEPVVEVDSELESLLSFDRPVNWAEHATIGSPFLEPEQTVIDRSASRCLTRFHGPRPGPRRLSPSQEFRWPMAPALDGSLIDQRFAPPGPPSMDHTACRMDAAQRNVWVTALNRGKRLVLGYMFRQEEFPWLQDWMNYAAPHQMARGLEFATQPFDVPRRQAIGTGTLFDTPTYRWLPAKSRISARFLMFWAQVPQGFGQVDEVRLEPGRLVLQDYASGQRLELATAATL